MSTKKETERTEEKDFETCLGQLEQICETLEKENISLEAALKAYEEGVRLVRLCTRKLESAEREIKILRVSADGEVVEKDFEIGGKSGKEGEEPSDGSEKE